MAQVHVLVVDLDPSLVEDADGAAEPIRAAIERNIAVLRKLGYDADFCGTDEGKTAPDVLLAMMRAKRYGCLVMSAASASTRAAAGCSSGSSTSRR